MNPRERRLERLEERHGKAVVTTVAKDTAGNRLDQNPSVDGPQPMKWFFTIRR